MISSKIKKITAREILESRGYPTLEVELATEQGFFISAVPAGTSRGKNEAWEMRDGGQRYGGMGVSKAVKKVNEIIAPALLGRDATAQKEIDELLIGLDGTKNKAKLGANAILGVSMAVSRAGAASQRMPLWQWLSKLARTKAKLPQPCLLYIEGGSHGRGDLSTQELMLAIEGETFREQLQTGTEIYHRLREILSKKYRNFPINVGLEGGFTPPVSDTKEALDLIMKAAGSFRKKTKIILDMAASAFYKNGRYCFEGEMLKKEDLLDFYLKLCQNYPIAAIEDPFAEEDWVAWQALKAKLKKHSSKIWIIGDDLTVTNPGRIKLAFEKEACSAVIAKPNQIGTVWETLEAAKTALKYGWQVFVKHRSGETVDTFISDLAVGLGTGWLMAGAPHRGERVAKYNRLLRIEEEIKRL